MLVENADLFVFSPTGSSIKISKNFIKDFDNYNINDFTIKSSVKEYKSNHNSLAVFSFPVYAGRVPETFLDRIEKIEGDNTPAVIIAVYGNRAFDDAIIEMYDILEEKNYHVIAASAFLAEHSYTNQVANGRPDKNDINIIKSFSNKVKELLESNDDFSKLELNIPGNRPYRTGMAESKSAPEPGEGCISCGVCSMVCPMQIVEPDGEMPDENIKFCLHCLACIKRCPSHVRFIESEEIEKFSKYLIENFGDLYKKPDIFMSSKINS